MTAPPTLIVNLLDLSVSAALNWVSTDALCAGYSTPSEIVVSLVPVPEIDEILALSMSWSLPLTLVVPLIVQVVPLWATSS